MTVTVTGGAGSPGTDGEAAGGTVTTVDPLAGGTAAVVLGIFNPRGKAQLPPVTGVDLNGVSQEQSVSMS